jgi:hypothetical protein
MGTKAQELLELAMRLPPGERSDLAERLRSSLADRTFAARGNDSPLDIFDQLKARIVKSGLPLLSDDELRDEIRERKGR